MPNPVVHFEISAKDEKKCREFYAGLFDWKVQYEAQFSYAMIHPDAPSGIDGGIGPAHGGPTVTIYVQVADLKAALTKAESLGGKTVTPPMEIPGECG